MNRIIDAVVQAINSHQETALGIVGSIFTGIVGAIFGVALDRWVTRGKVKVYPVSMHWRFEGGAQDPKRAEDAQQIHYDFELRAVNTFQHAASMALLAVEFFPREEKKPGKPLLSDSFLMIGLDFKDTLPRDVLLPAQAFTRVYLSGAGTIREEVDKEERTRRLSKFRAVRMTFLVTPEKKIELWHTFTPKEMHEGPKEKIIVTRH